MSGPGEAHRLLRSTGAATALQLWRMALVFGTNLLLRRWVDVDSWGLWTWVESLYLLIASLRDFGMSSHVIRLQPRPYRKFLLTQVLWGTALAALVVLLAPLIALGNADPDPRLVPVLQALSLYLVLEGLATVPLIYFEAELSIERTLVAELLRPLVYAALALGLALLGYGVWSFVAAQLVAAAVFAALLWWQALGRLPLAPSAVTVRALVRGSLPLGGIWFLALAVAYLDPLVLGAHFTLETVAAYTFAYFAAFLPSRILLPPIKRAIYPAFVAFTRPRVFDAYRLATLSLLGLEVPAALLLATNAELVLRLLGGDQWGAAAPFLRLLAFAPIVDPLGRLGGELLIAHHRERLRALSLAITFLSMLAGALLLIPRFGAFGMAFANFLPFGWLVGAWGVYSLDRPRTRNLLGEIASVYLWPVPLFLFAWWASGGSPWLRLALSTAAAVIAMALQWRRFGRSFLDFVRAPGHGAPAAAAGATAARP